MTTYRVSLAAELLGVSDDTVRRWADSGRLASERGPDGRRSFDGRELAKFAVDMAGTQAPDQPPSQSVRNRFLGIVTNVIKDKVMAQIEIQAGPHRFVSLISREAADELKLSPGVMVDAVVKATSVGVEIVTPRSH